MTSEVRLQVALQLLLLPSWNQPSIEEAQLVCWFSGELEVPSQSRTNIEASSESQSFPSAT